MRHRLFAHVAPMMAVVLIAATVAPLASAEVAEEGSYPDGSGKAGAEMICRAYSQAFKERWSRKPGVEGPALRMRAMLLWAGRHLRTTYRQLRALSWPAEDQPLITRWLERVHKQPGLTERLAATLGGEPFRQEVAQLRVSVNGEVANGIVAPFGFHYCRFNGRGLLR
jgi:hypothetical protein